MRQFSTLEIAVLTGILILGTISYLVALLVPITSYGEEFSREAFNTIRLGDSLDTVRQKIGEPLVVHPIPYRKVLSYPERGLTLTLDEFEANYYSVTKEEGSTENLNLRGQRLEEIVRQFGRPSVEEDVPGFQQWDFSKPLLNNGSYKYFILVVDTKGGAVMKKAFGNHFD